MSQAQEKPTSLRREVGFGQTLNDRLVFQETPQVITTAGMFQFP